MKTRRRFGIKSLLVVIMFAALTFAWWSDHQHLSERVIDANQETNRVTQENAKLRQSLRAAQATTDRLFAQTLSQQDAINQLKQFAIVASKRPGAGK